jgi:RecG-like helicase
MHLAHTPRTHTPLQEKRALLGQVASGEVQVVISTHAVLNVGNWHKLGLVVIDEQHRWGARGARGAWACVAAAFAGPG